jgi:hypothetical protein
MIPTRCRPPFVRHCWHSEAGTVARSVAGAVKKALGVAVSTTRPRSRNTIRLASRAKAISRHDDHGHAILCQPAHDDQNLSDQLGVERAGRLIEQQQLRTHGERPRDSHALLQAAGEFGREHITFVRQAHLGEQCLRLYPHLCFGPALHLDGRLHDVLQNGQVRPEREMLEHHADARAHARQVSIVHDDAARGHADTLAAEIDFAAVRPLQPVDASEQRRLARARRTQQAHRLAAMHAEADVVQHDQGAECLGDSRHGQHRAPLIRGRRSVASHRRASAMRPVAATHASTIRQRIQ